MKEKIESRGIESKGLSAISASSSGKMGIFWAFLIPLVELGTIMLVLSLTFGNESVGLIQAKTINGITFYELNIWQYLTNLSLSIDPTKLTLATPTFNFNGVINPFISVVNILIMIANLITYMIRIPAYFALNIMAILGINMNPEITHGLTWLIDIAKFLSELNIPYINYV